MTGIFTYFMKQSLLGKLTGFQLVTKFPALFEPEGSFTAIRSARHLSLS
jgi:hypothetical protein